MDIWKNENVPPKNRAFDEQMGTPPPRELAHVPDTYYYGDKKTILPRVGLQL